MSVSSPASGATSGHGLGPGQIISICSVSTLEMLISIKLDGWDDHYGIKQNENKFLCSFKIGFEA